MSRNKPTKKKKLFNKKYSPDNLILYFTIFMAIFGAIMIFDASVYKANEEFGNPFHFLKLQTVWIFIGALAATLIYLKK